MNAVVTQGEASQGTSWGDGQGGGRLGRTLYICLTPVLEVKNDRGVVYEKV
uniref:Uncharacterized protein n=1 Tax=viral metagenome TaxID=1070528 RepID=A0A6M3LY56_9ZZZZ